MLTAYSQAAEGPTLSAKKNRAARSLFLEQHPNGTSCYSPGNPVNKVHLSTRIIYCCTEKGNVFLIPLHKLKCPVRPIETPEELA